MEKEDYVSLQVAKLLKEKGFNEICSAAYSIEDENINPLFYGTFQNNGDGYVAGHIAAPTLYEAQKWLWNNHRILVTAFLNNPFSEPYGFVWTIQDAKKEFDSYRNIISQNVYRSYQEAMNAGILEALKMI